MCRETDVEPPGLHQRFGNAPLGTMQCTQGNAPQGMHKDYGTTTVLDTCCCCYCALRPPSFHLHVLQVLVLIFVYNFVFATNFVAEATALYLKVPYELKETDVYIEGETVECAKVWPRQIPMSQLRKSRALHFHPLNPKTTPHESAAELSSASDFINNIFLLKLPLEVYQF